MQRIPVERPALTPTLSQREREYADRRATAPFPLETDGVRHVTKWHRSNSSRAHLAFQRGELRLSELEWPEKAVTKRNPYSPTPAC